MKLIKNRLLAGCGITVLVLLCFFLFVSFDTGIPFQIGFSSFLIILGMSMLISLAALIFKLDTFPYPVRLVLHFLTLLGVMLGLLGATGVLAGKSTTQYFLLIVGYAFFYAIITLAIFGFKKLYSFVCDKYFPQVPPSVKQKHPTPSGIGTSKKNGASKPSGAKQKSSGKEDSEKSSYKPRFK